MSDCTLLQGDCLQLMPTLKASSINAVITDPPYGINYQSARRTDRAKWKPKIANDRGPFVWFLHESARVLMDGGCLLCFCRWDTAEAFRLAIGWTGLHVGAQLVWDRIGHGMGDPSSRPSPRHDLIWFAVKGRYQLPGKRPSSVYAVPQLAGSQLDHPNEKPEPLIARLIADYVPPGGTVLDPFAGSGTTLVAALATGHRAIGIEISSEYIKIARKRLAAAGQRRIAA